MASATKLSVVLFFACSLLVQKTLAHVECGLLPKNVCMFAIMTSGEDQTHANSCQKVCGVDHLISDGVSPDGRFSKDFVLDICSPPCYDHCRGIVALFAKVAAQQGQHLPQLCVKHGVHLHRALYQVSSSDAGVAATPAVAPQAADALIADAPLADSPLADAPLADSALADAPLADAPATAFDDDYA
ncbi:hypothetical protein Salat_0955500 [Sesamum alatum]|uniref:Uncharacterized protein n=1 Tax=Sesamum alatum TaxID=300844 RepID=A0AAE1YKZ2_9LAMI|nr:hypothetical protein Salat_0955500 [Sesamum alatum]